LEQVAGDRATRNEAAARAGAIATAFSWDRTAAITMAAYERALAGKTTTCV
jgi:hypothetical protein